MLISAVLFVVFARLGAIAMATAIPFAVMEYGGHFRPMV